MIGDSSIVAIDLAITANGRATGGICTLPIWKDSFNEIGCICKKRMKRIGSSMSLRSPYSANSKRLISAFCEYSGSSSCSWTVMLCTNSSRGTSKLSSTFNSISCSKTETASICFAHGIGCFRVTVVTHRAGFGVWPCSSKPVIVRRITGKLIGVDGDETSIESTCRDCTVSAIVCFIGSSLISILISPILTASSSRQHRPAVVVSETPIPSTSRTIVSFGFSATPSSTNSSSLALLSVKLSTRVPPSTVT